MANGGFGPFVPKGSSEYGRPGMETEVKVPVQTYVWIGVVGTISLVVLMVVVWLFRLHSYLKSDPARCLNVGYWWRQFPVVCWLTGVWWPRFRVWWPIDLAVIGIWWAIVPAAPTLYRFILEQGWKWNPPPTAQWDPANGLWWPWSKVPKSPPESAGRGGMRGHIDFGLEGDDDSND